jgi:hypothetical protein
MQFIGKVEGKSTGWTHTVEVCDCNESCQGATGPKCTCRCGAENHGVGFRYHEHIDATGKVTITPEGDNAKRIEIAQEFRKAYQAAREKMLFRLDDNWTKYINHVWIDRAAWDGCNAASKMISDIRAGKQHKSRMSKIAKFNEWLDKWYPVA